MIKETVEMFKEKPLGFKELEDKIKEYNLSSYKVITSTQDYMSGVPIIKPASFERVYSSNNFLKIINLINKISNLMIREEYFNFKILRVSQFAKLYELKIWLGDPDMSGIFNRDILMAQKIDQFFQEVEV